MSGATRKGLPKCEELVTRFSYKRSYVGMKRCNKTSVAIWYWRAASDEPKYVCRVHDKQINDEEMKDEMEREYDEREEDSL